MTLMITEYTIELRMEKSIQRITQPICVRINENETQQIRAKLMYENNPYSIQCDSAELHLLRDDGTWSHMEASVSGSSVTCTIKANQLGKTAQNACAYFFFQKGTKTETTESFQVRIERAAIDTEASDAFFDASMNRIATKWGAYEATAEAQESARKDAESKRVTAEQERVQAEQSRLTAEQKRVSAENERASAEQKRISAEQNREEVNELVISKESERREAERSRVEAEQSRASAEERRAQAESTRQQSESTRTSAEQSRQSRFNEMLDAAQNVKFRILSSTEVDSEGKPTITGSSGIIYLVKAQQAQETQANHYNEWIYLEGRWELFGSTAPTAAAIEVADIDKLANGTTIAGNRVLNATGLNALWSKLQARMQAAQSTAKQADKTAKEAKSDITYIALRQTVSDEKVSTLESETAILKSRTLSVEQKLENGLENARKSRVVLRIRSISEDKNHQLWCNCSFVNTNGFVDFNGYINTGLIPASIMNRAKGIEGKIFFAFDDVLCELFQPMLDDNISSFPLVWHSTRGKNVYGYLQILFWSICLALPCEENNPNNYRIGEIYTHATYPQSTPHINNSFDGFPQFIEKINKTLGKDGLVASYELY